MTRLIIAVYAVATVPVLLVVAVWLLELWYTGHRIVVLFLAIISLGWITMRPAGLTVKEEEEEPTEQEEAVCQDSSPDI